MQSSPSNSVVSRIRRGGFDPSVVLLPIFVGLLRAAPFAPFIAMFLHPGFGLSNDHPAPNAWALAAISAIGFWTVRLLTRRVRDQRVLNVLLLVIGILCWGIWMALEPDWHIGAILRRPISMVSGEGQFGWTFVITIIFWVLTLKLALDEREQSSEGVRGIMVRSLVAVLAGVLLAAVIGGEMGDAGLSAGYIALPVALVSGVGAVGMSEMSATRAAARKRGATVPGWSRWSRTFLGSAAVILLITFVAAVIFGPGFLSLVLDTLATIWRGIATVILWVAYGFIYVIYWIGRAIAWLINTLFGGNIGPIEMPAPIQQGTPEASPREPAPIESFPYADLIRFGGIILLVLVGLALLARFARSRGSENALDPDEERSSVFSGSLLRNQLGGLFRRRGHGERPRKLDLAQDPTSVRESMLYLQVLAERLETPRRPNETARQFTGRLGREWSNVQEPLAEINRRYERVRYGEHEEDRIAAVDAWRQIWAAQQAAPGADGKH